MIEYDGWVDKIFALVTGWTCIPWKGLASALTLSHYNS